MRSQARANDPVLIPMRLRLRRAAVLFALFAGNAAATPLFGPAASDRIPAGRVEVLALGPAAAGAEERELVLSLDGGRSFPLRLTGEIEPGDRTASWRVPALPTEHAVLALREGGVGFEEAIVAMSAEFAILSAPGSSLAELRFRDGEWRTREADAGDDALPAKSLGSAESERVDSLDDSLAAFEEPVRALPAVPNVAAAPVDASVASGPPAGTPSKISGARFLPLRE